MKTSRIKNKYMFVLIRIRKLYYITKFEFKHNDKCMKTYLIVNDKLH